MKRKSLLSKFTFFLPKIMKYLPYSFQKYAVKSTPCVTRPQAQKNTHLWEHPCRSAILIKLQSNFIEITLWNWCSPVDLLHIFQTPFPKNIFGRQLLTCCFSLFFKQELGWGKSWLSHNCLVMLSHKQHVKIGYGYFKD